MEETKAYKLNKEKQPAGEKGKFLYYFYNNETLDSVAVDEEQWEKLVALDTEMYNNDRRHKTHSTKLNEDVTPCPDGEKGFFNDTEYYSEEDYCRQKDIENLLLKKFSEQDRNIYEYYKEGCSQKEMANALGISQGQVAKRLSVILDAVETENLNDGDHDSDEIIALKQWRKYTRHGATDNEEDILWDIFRVEAPLPLQEEICSWFYSYKEYCYFAIKYLVLRPWEKYDCFERGTRLNELPYQVRAWFYDYYEYEPPCFQWLFIAFFEHVEEMKKRLKHKPSEINFERLIEKCEKAAKRLNMTEQDFLDKNLIPFYADKRKKRYQKALDELYMLIVDENDTRPIGEQMIAFMEHCKKLDKKFGQKIVTKNLQNPE